jgi:hypothetical protein
VRWHANGSANMEPIAAKLGKLRKPLHIRRHVSQQTLFPLIRKGFRCFAIRAQETSRFWYYACPVLSPSRYEP